MLLAVGKVVYYESYRALIFLPRIATVNRIVLKARFSKKYFLSWEIERASGIPKI